MLELPAFDAFALSLHHSPGTHSLLVGSGLSRAAGIPTGWEITLDLIRRLAALDGVTEHADWAKWFKDKHGKEADYSELLAALASTPAERRAILHSYIEPSEGNEARRPTKAHHSIAHLVSSGAVRVIVTTNFDRLIETALREAGIEPTVIAGDDAIAGATPLVHSKCTVIKVHGDYMDSRIKNTEAEVGTYSQAMNGLLDEVFDNFGLTVVGWSADWDQALRAAIMRAPSRRYPFYWAARSTVSTLAQDVINVRGGRSFPIADADSFFVKLSQTLEALKQASGAHPQSIEMAVALAKRYCRDDKFAMEWAEFLNGEVEKIRLFVSGPQWPSVHPTPPVLNGLVGHYLAATQVFRRACLVCARWGTIEANHAVFRAIKNVSFYDESIGGFAIYASMRQLAASLGFYWNLAGLVEREAWPLIKQLFSIEFASYRNKISSLNLLPLNCYENVDWKFLNGLERRRTVASDFIFEQIEGDAVDAAIAGKQIEELFDRVEFLISMEFAHHRLKDVNRSVVWFWMPPGRYLWRASGAVLNELLERFEAMDDEAPVYKAGLLGGSKIASAPTFKAVREHIPKLSSALMFS